MGILGNQCFSDNFLQLVFTNINLHVVLKWQFYHVYTYMYINRYLNTHTNMLFFLTDTQFWYLTDVGNSIPYISFCIAYEIAYTRSTFANCKDLRHKSVSFSEGSSFGSN